MKIGFDLDGTLDRPAIRDLALALLHDGHEVHIVTGMFPDGQMWQGEKTKVRKLKRLGIPFTTWPETPIEGRAILHIIEAIPVSAAKNLEYVLRDLGLRKGALCEEHGITILFDDSQTYCEMARRMSDVTTVQVR